MKKGRNYARPNSDYKNEDKSYYDRHSKFLDHNRNMNFDYESEYDAEYPSKNSIPPQKVKNIDSTLESDRYFGDESQIYESAPAEEWYSPFSKPQFHKKSETNYAGVGPKNVARSDQRLKEDICEELELNSDIDAREIDVEIDEGILTLTGTVPDRWMKYEAEDIAENIRGVKEVNNHLRVA